MSLSLSVPPVWVDKPNLLVKACEEIAKFDAIGIDTESNSLFAYQEQVCLIQISAREKDYLIDPLSIPDLTPLGNLMADAHIEKVFHAAEYDIICLKRDHNFKFRSIFDTMHACRILGEANLGLAAQLEKHFSYVHNKKYQRADWGKRPLTEEMLNYARIDSHFLVSLRDILKPQLKEKGLLDLAAEDFAHLIHVEPTPLHDDLTLVWRIIGNSRLPAEKVSILQSLLDYRENYAIRADTPPFKVLGNDVLLELAVKAPATKDELTSTGLTERNIQRHGNALLSAIKIGATQPPPVRPPNRFPGNSYLRRYDALRKWRKQRGEELGVESDIILPKNLLEDLVANPPQSKSELRSLMKYYPWRFKQYSNDILSLLKERN